MPEPANPKLYHIVHTDRLPSIKTRRHTSEALQAATPKPPAEVKRGRSH